MNQSTHAAAWHALASEAAADRLETEAGSGLDEATARRLLEQHGPNRLTEQPATPSWLLFAEQFKGLLILVLVAASGIAFVIGEVKDAVVILVVVVLNAILGFVQEYRAGQAVAALKKMLAPVAEVRREGRVRALPAADLVPGDVVLLDAGDRIPADGRLLASHSLEIDESSLTGESHPVSKDAEVVLDPNTPLSDRVNMAFMNTNVTRGRAELLITATGMQTEMGRVASLLEAADAEPTPLQRDLGRLGRRLAAIAGVVIAIIVVLALLRGESLPQVLLSSIALAVAAIPEGLPAVVTVTLALGMRRMARRRAIVKRLASVETLGCTTVICADKTGTLTLNRMTARRLLFRGVRYEVTGEGYTSNGEIRAVAAAGQRPDLSPLLLPVAFCNDSRLRHGEVVGDPTEGALLVLAAKGGVQHDAGNSRLPRIAEIPFDSAHKFMATFHFDGDQVRIFVKGAPDIVLARCASWLGPDGEEVLSDSTREGLLRENEALAARALRVLAVAQRTVPASAFDPTRDLAGHVQQLTLAGLVGLMDLPRREARPSILRCRQAGIQIKMITGDHRTTAAAVAEELGIPGRVLSGSDLDQLSDGELAACIAGVGVFARVSPEHKVRIVRALKQERHIVAMTGDGVNDAPALRSADIGVAMGRAGTEVTKEASDMVLTDDDFATIVRAVREGRMIYDNIGKFLRFQLSTNFGAVFSVFVAPFLGLPLPFNPIQILWVNIIMDGPPAMALGADPAHPGVMNSPPRRRDTPVLSAVLIARLVSFGALMAAGTLGVLWWALQTGSPEHARTLAFTTFVAFQVFNAFNVRSDTSSLFSRHSLANGSLWLSLAAVIALQVMATNWRPAQLVFHGAELSAIDGLVATGVGATVLVYAEVLKLALRLTRRSRRAAG